MHPRKRIRLFLDSNVITSGIVSRWGLDKAVLSLCSARLAQLVLAEAVREEVEENLLMQATGRPVLDGEQLIADYTGFVKLSRPEIVVYPEASSVRISRHLIRHEADVPVLLSAMATKPDWLITNNTKHFTQVVAYRTGLRIATPAEFFRELAGLMR